ncbi:MAG: sn-glycerol-3-phosphate ABC transporter ATP-binding protein UgpC [Ruminiclostridium sp.]|nr:sn-glycerol-3-phosphate ABC transporter ATP-binding protein UgpC [Ruminiclostridium sp.]
MAYLTLRGINKIYPNGFHAVHDFNMEIEKGEFIVFVGSSGCGKSTTLRMIAGLENISKGEFYIDGEKVNEKGPRERGVAMVFQSYALYPHMSVYDNLAFGLMLQGVDDDVIEKKVLSTAKILGLTDYLDRLPRELSGGQRQRVAVGRAIIRKVNIFLMDEPLSNLDAKQRVTMRSEITQIHRETGATTIYVTHDQTEAMTMADRIVVMKDGYIQQIGTPYDLYFNPVNMFVAGFIGEPPMNFIEAKVKKGRLALSESDIDLGAVADDDVLKQYEGSEIVFGFRPEAVKSDLGGSTKRAYHIKSFTNLVELLGDNTNVYVNFDGFSSILKVEPHHAPSIGSTFEFAIPFDSVYLFDKHTEKRIKLRKE